MWNLAGEGPEEKRRNTELLQRSFHGLNGRIPGLRRLEIGVDTSGVDYACDVVLYSEFESQEALDAYARHPEHLRVKAKIGDMRIARHQVDYVVSTVQSHDQE
jgi:heme-degrading monooxygenase HmoA